MRRRAFPLALVLAWPLTSLAAPASAQDGIFTGMQKSIDSVFSSTTTTTTFASGATTKTTTTNVYPALTLNLDSLLYPNLRLNAGGVFELNLFTVRGGGGDTDSTISRNRPYVLLRSTNPVFAPGAGYFRREDRSRTAGSQNVKLVNDEWAGYLKWNPVGGPLSDFQFLRTRTFDGARAFQNVTRHFGTLLSNYTYGSLTAHYRGAYLRTDDRLQALETRQLTHAARVSYSGSHLRKRLSWNAAYSVNYQNVTTTASGTGGEVPIPVVPFAGLSSISDTPTTSRLSQNPLLIDGNLAAAAGADLGLTLPPADPQARNIGLDFLNPAEVNRLLVWVDRELPVEVSNSFSWEIYSSIDNVLWRRESSLSSVPFGPFENRFQLDFPAVTARYLKVVVRPLSPVVPEAARFDDILVTELQAFSRRPAGAVRGTLSRTTNLVNADVRFRLLDAPSLFYEGLYLYNGPNAFGRSTNTVSNGVSANQTFWGVFSAYGRVAYEQGAEPSGDRVATVTNGTLTVAPIPAFRSSVLYTGQDERIAGERLDRKGVIIQNSAQIYRGVDVLVGIGWNATTRRAGEISRDRLVNASATVVPRQHVSFTFSYDDTTTRYAGLLAGRPDSYIRRAYGAVAIDPTTTFHLVVGGELAVVSGQRRRTALDLGLNWTPFRDGALQFIVATNEALRPLEFGRYRNLLGTVRWNVSRRSYIDLTYQKTRNEFVEQTSSSRMLSLALRLFL